LVFYRTSRGNTVLLLAAVLITLGLVVASRSEAALLYAGIGMFLFYYTLKLLLGAQVRALDKLEISRVFSKRTSEGKPVEVVLTFVNHTFLRLTVEIVDNYPKFFRLVSGTNVAVLNIPAKGYAELRYVIKPTSIGANKFGPLRTITRDIAGLFFYERSIEIPTNMIEVTPAQIEVSRGSLSTVVLSAYGGSLTSKRKGEGMEFDDLREYEQGDPYKRIEWLSTARTGRLMVRQLRADTQLNIMVLLDSTQTMAYGEAGQTKLDYSARSVASLLGYLGRRGDFIGITVMKGENDFEIVPLGRGETQITRIMHILGNISPSASTGANFSEAVRRALVLGRVKGRTLFFVITDLDSEADLSALKQLLVMHHEVIVISPFTPLFESHGLEGLDKAIYSISASHQWATREKLISEAARLGVPVLDVGPRDIFPKLVMQVEEMRSKGGS